MFASEGVCSIMSQAARKLISFGTFAGIVGLGYFLMKMTVPDKDALMEV